MENKKKKKKLDIPEILERENKCPDFINLYLVGRSWKAYEQSVCKIDRCCKEGNDLLLCCKEGDSLLRCFAEGLMILTEYVSSVRPEVYLIRIPEGSLLRIFDPARIERVSDSQIRIPCPPLEESYYQNWLAVQSTNPYPCVECSLELHPERDLRVYSALLALNLKAFDQPAVFAAITAAG
ncbi:MAG: hypothetical protein LBR26_13610 [Prevotella sp.]|jgi:hypothetical protein|nr:hypothetical protein [Prevotella sp.]